MGDIEPFAQLCPHETCQCNGGYAPQEGELCEVKYGVIQEALQEIYPDDADKMLFKALVRAALAAPEGCVWKSGGKYVLSGKGGCQTIIAILNYLDAWDAMCGKAMRALMAFTEERYGVTVSAMQINIHPDEKTCHKQHRDVYGAAGELCMINPSVGTICYSIGSSRHMKTQTMTDSRSRFMACGEDCKGRRDFWVLRSDSACFFNRTFNNNWSHGVPPIDAKCGPRISIALLLTKYGTKTTCC